MNSISTIINSMLEYYGARTHGTEERRIQRLARFVNFTDWHFEGVEEEPVQQKTKATKQEQPVAHRTRSRQAVAHRTRSSAH
jgi:hypothetical protein